MKILTLILGSLCIMMAAVLLAFSIVAGSAIGIIIGLGSMAATIAVANLIYEV